jgi:hypothetical protein
MPAPEPTAAQRAQAKALVAARSDAEVVALVGNWRPPKPPPLIEFVRHTLIVAKESGELIPFALWPAQEEALEVIEQADKLVMPKGRQVGITWLELAAMLWAGTFWGMRLLPIARQSDEYARDAIGRLLVLAGYDPASEPSKLRRLPQSPLPEAWRPKIVGKTRRELRLENGSVFRALTATQPIARGLAAYWGLADEYAFWPWPAKQLAAMESGCARLHVVSTGNGEDDAFAALYHNAVAGRGEYKAFFLPSDADPRRDPDWYRRNVEEAADPESARREHALCPEDAFRAPEGVFFKRFSSERNVAKLPIMRSWQTYRAIDFGYRHPACLWAQQAPTGQLFIIDELLPENLSTPEFIAQIKTREAGFGLVEPVVASYCDPAGRATNTQTAESEFAICAREGLNPFGQPSSVRDGCVRIMDALAHPVQPLVIGECCGGLIRALAQVKAHRSSPDIYDTDHELFSHPLDALRYLLVNAADSPPYDPNAVRVLGDGPHRGNDPLGRPAPHSPGQPRIHVRY